MIMRTIWRSERFGKLTAHRDKVAHFYLLTCEHQNSIGCFRLPAGYAIADLRWSLEDWQASIAALKDVGLIDFDQKTDEVMIERWLAKNPPTNKKHADGARNLIMAIESDVLGDKVQNDFLSAWQDPPEFRVNTGRLDQTSFMQGRSR